MNRRRAKTNSGKCIVCEVFVMESDLLPNISWKKILCGAERAINVDIRRISQALKPADFVYAGFA
jgi:hypothetical protein